MTTLSKYQRALLETKSPALLLDVEIQAKLNTDFRRVLVTGDRTQLVAMSLPPNTDIGEETHTNVEQVLTFVEGQGQIILDEYSYDVGPGVTVVIRPGVKHNVQNTGSSPLRLYTLYSPPNHLPGRVHATKADAEKDAADAAIEREWR